MLATNKTPLLDQQVFSKQNLFELIKVFCEVSYRKNRILFRKFTRFRRLQRSSNAKLKLFRAIYMRHVTYPT